MWGDLSLTLGEQSLRYHANALIEMLNLDRGDVGEILGNLALEFADGQ